MHKLVFFNADDQSWLHPGEFETEASAEGVAMNVLDTEMRSGDNPTTPTTMHPNKAVIYRPVAMLVPEHRVVRKPWSKAIESNGVIDT